MIAEDSGGDSGGEGAGRVEGGGVEEKLCRIKKYEEKRREYAERYKPMITEKFTKLLDRITALLSEYDVEIDDPSIAIPAEAKKYREKECVVYPAVLKREGGRAKLYFVYRNDEGVVDVVEARSAPLVDVLAVSSVMDKFQSMVEEAIIDAMLERSREDYEKITGFMKRAGEAYNRYAKLFDAIKTVSSAGMGQEQREQEEQEEGESEGEGVGVEKRERGGEGGGEE